MKHSNLIVIVDYTEYDYTFIFLSLVLLSDFFFASIFSDKVFIH